MARAVNSMESLLKDLEKKAKATANKIALAIADEIKESIQTNVYDYYDEIRSGLVRNPYQRTGELLKGVEVKRGRLQAWVEVNAHTPDILHDIETGKTNWKNSVLYKLSPNQRKRPFMKEALDNLDFNLDNYVIESFSEYGLHVKRER